MKKVFAMLCILASSCAFGQSYIAVTATNVQVDNGSGGAVNPPSGSNLCFLGVNNVGAAITYTPSGGSPVTGAVCQTLDGSGNLTGSLQVANPAIASPIGLLYTITVVNGTTTYLTIPKVSISGALFQFSNFTLPVNGVALGIGFPHLSCTAGALWTSTTLPSGQQAFTCTLVSGVGSWLTFPKGGSYCPVGMGYVTPQITGTPFCISPSYSGTGAPTGSCINNSTYYQQDDPGVVYGCINGAWSPIAGGGVPGLTSFQGRSTPGATVQSGDITGILQNGPFGLTGTQGMLFDQATGTAQPSSNWVLGTGSNAGKLYGYKDLNLAPNSATAPVATINASTGAASFGNGTATVSAAGVAAVAAGSTVNGSPICTTANGACPTSGAAYYQTAQNATTPLTQRSKMNFITSTGIAGADDSGNASTNVSLSGIPNASLTNSSITVNVTGAATGGGTIPLGGSTTINVSGTGTTGTQYAISGFTGGSSGGGFALGQTNSFTDATGNPLTVPGTLTGNQTNGIYNSDQFSSGGGNNGIANLLAGDCVTAGCFFARPFTSTDTENVPSQLTGEYVHALDSLYGAGKNYYFNAGINGSTTARNAEEHNYFWNDTLAISNENLVGRNNIYTSAQAGIYVGSPWTIAKENNSTDYFYTRSISQHESSITNAFHVGDAAIHYDYINYRGGSIAAHDESVKGNVIQEVEAFGPFGTINTGGPNATVINSHFTVAPGNQGDGYNLVDVPDVMASGLLTANTITTGLQPNYWTTSDTHSVSTGIAILSANCGANVTRNAPVQTVCPVTIVSGSFTTGATVTACVGDPGSNAFAGEPEQVNVSAVGAGTLTLGLAYAHQAGVYIEQGGMCGAKIALGYGIDPTTTGNREFTTYFAVGSHSANTIDYVSVYKGGQNEKQFVPVPSIGNPISLGSITRAGNVVTVTNPGASNYAYNQFVAPGTSAITVAGATPSDLNGTVTGVTVTPSKITWNQTGADETGSGGTLSVTGYNNYIAPCGAETVKVMNVVMDTTGKPVTDGTLQVEPNNCPWTPGDAVAQPNHYASNVVGLNIAMNGFTKPDTFGNQAISISTGGPGMSGQTMLNFTTSDPLSAFQGFGGTEMPRLFASGNDYYGGMFSFAHAPLNGGPVITIGPSAEGVNANSYDYQLFSVSGVDGQDFFNFSPSTSTFKFQKLGVQSLCIAGCSVPIQTVIGNQSKIMTTDGSLTTDHLLIADGNKNIEDSGIAKASVCLTSGTNCPTPFITSITTTGSSGPSTVSGGVLNIPQYAGSGGVTSINTTPGAFTFSGSGVSCSGTTCTFSGTGTGIGSITWAIPSWLAASPTTISASGTQTFSAATGQTSHQVLGTCGTGTSFGPCALVAGDIPALPYLSSGTQLPVTKTATTHQFFTAYDSTTGLYTAAALLSGDIPNNAASTSGNASTATALASTPTLCSTGQAPTGILANGNATGCASIGGGGMVYPGAGVPVSTGTAWSTSKAAPTGALVGDSDTQTLTNKTMGAGTSFVDGTGHGGGVNGLEGTAPTGTSSWDNLWADSTAHRFKMINNNGSAVTVASLSDFASSSFFGVVKVDGTSITASGGVISATVSAAAFTTLTDGTPITWAAGAVALANASVTLAHTTSTRAINISGMTSGTNGVLVIKQDSTGGAALTLGTGCTWYIGGSTGFVASTTLSLTTTASAINILAFTYDGTNCYGNLR